MCHVYNLKIRNYSLAKYIKNLIAMEVTDDQEDLLSEVNFVPCVKFVKRGVAAPKTIAEVIAFDNILPSPACLKITFLSF